MRKFIRRLMPNQVLTQLALIGFFVVSAIGSGYVLFAVTPPRFPEWAVYGLSAFFGLGTSAGYQVGLKYLFIYEKVDSYKYRDRIFALYKYVRLNNWYTAIGMAALFFAFCMETATTSPEFIEAKAKEDKRAANIEKQIETLQTKIAMHDSIATATMAAASETYQEYDRATIGMKEINKFSARMNWNTRDDKKELTKLETELAGIKGKSGILMEGIGSPVPAISFVAGTVSSIPHGFFRFFLMFFFNAAMLTAYLGGLLGWLADRSIVYCRLAFDTEKSKVAPELYSLDVRSSGRTGERTKKRTQGEQVIEQKPKTSRPAPNVTDMSGEIKERQKAEWLAMVEAEKANGNPHYWATVAKKIGYKNANSFRMMINRYKKELQEREDVA